MARRGYLFLPPVSRGYFSCLLRRLIYSYLPILEGRVFNNTGWRESIMFLSKAMDGGHS